MICPMMHFYKRPSGSHGSRGNVIAFEQEIDTFAEDLIQLPRPPEELPIVVLQSKGAKGTVNFKVNRKHGNGAGKARCARYMRDCAQTNPEIKTL